MKWHHSLYWRIAVGFVGCLALLLVVQALLFVWVAARSAPIPNQPPDRFAQTIAIDVTEALGREPSLDVGKYIRDEYARDAQPFFVVLADGRAVEMGGAIAPSMIQEARLRLQNLRERGPVDRGGRMDRSRFGPGDQAAPRDGAPPVGRGEFGRGDGGRGDGRSESGRGNFGRGFGRGGPGGLFRPAPIISDGMVVGLVVVPPQPPFGFLLSRYAPTLTVVAIGTLILGAVLAAALIFGPARKRLRAVEDAARRLGAGDLGARAPASGRDEVAAVASAFNAMATDLSARAAALAASDRARRQLLADVSHELTTPVTAIRGYLETLRMPELGLDDATRTRYVDIIADETNRLERMIGDLLDLARLEGGGGSLTMAEVPVDQLFARVLARHERAAADAGVTMTTSIGDDAAIVRGDRDRLEQALQNLAANALRYAPTGSAITLAARREGRDTVLTVTDAGAGISADHLPHVFDRFFKADASRALRRGPAGSDGSGLGLSIVKAIVERHGGTATVHSKPGCTVFELRIQNAEFTNKQSGSQN